MNSETKWLIALNLLKGVGPGAAKLIVGAVGNAEDVFKIDPRELVQNDEKIGSGFIEALQNKEVAIRRADEEMEYVEKHNIEVVNFWEEDFPVRLNQCPDGPLVIYKLGKTDLNATKMLSVVGTRNPSRYGEDICEEIVEELAIRYPDVVIVSGLAYGIDGCSHRVALKNNLRTVGVLGHGLHTIYPPQHREMARQMIEEGGSLITEYISGSYPDPRNFLARNRIIAGLSDGTLVIESGYKGGSLSTATHAQNYNREVMAIPGSPKADKSRGCNALIRGDKARLVENAVDVAKSLNWDIQKDIKSKPVQQKMLPTFNNEDEQKIYELLEQHEYEDFVKNDIATQTGIPLPNVATAMFMMEAEGLITVTGNACRIRRR